MALATIATLLVCACTPSRPRPVLTTTAERSGYVRTGRYDEAERLCHAFAEAYREARCDQVGRSTQGRPILALSIRRRAELPVIAIQAGIHAGEIEGKDAGFAFLRDLLDGKVAAGALDHVGVVFVPVLNPDGHERFGPNHRPNQRGPEEMGFRTNATRLNLNRDYVKAASPEIRALLGVVARFDPVMLVDLHTTDGAKFEHDISVLTAPIAPRPDELEETAAALSVTLLARLGALGHLPIDFYPSFVDDERPHSGFTRGEAPPRFSSYYMPTRNRIGVLVETHSWRPYAERAQSTYHTLQALFEEAPRSAGRWRAVAQAADAAAPQLAGTEVTMSWTTGPAHREIPFRGYAYERRLSQLTGGTWLVYDETRPEIWRVPLYDELVPATVVTAPRGGYVVDGGFASAVSELLVAHGIEFTPVAPDPTPAAVEVFRADRVAFQPPYEGKTRAVIEGAWIVEPRVLDRGAIFVPLAQPRARLVMHLFEPTLPDSLAQWGEFNAVFERKEYIEPYALEEAMRQLLAREPALRSTYEEALAADPALAASAEARLDWLFRRHPAWDERMNLLPVYRSARDLRASGSR